MTAKIINLTKLRTTCVWTGCSYIFRKNRQTNKKGGV